MYWYFDAWKQYAQFSGRASREAFWMFFLINGLISGTFIILDVYFSLSEYSSLWMLDAGYSLLSFLPLLSITVRRLHDTNRSAHWLWLILLPALGTILLLTLLAMPSEPNNNTINYSQVSVEAKSKKTVKSLKTLSFLIVIPCSLIAFLMLLESASTMSQHAFPHSPQEELKGIIFIESPKMGSLLSLRGIAGKGILISKANQADKQHEEQQCFSTSIAFAAGNFSGSSIHINTADPIRLNIYSDQIMEKLLSGSKIKSKDYIITKNDKIEHAQRSNQSKNPHGDIEIVSGLSKNYHFVLNTDESKWKPWFQQNPKMIRCD